ncbi:MAG: hypothetical protein HY078_03080 [Elusimicrobia bacterium]|nr:hypothetical protein [Elusimicrobiota bacterium]
MRTPALLILCAAAAYSAPARAAETAESYRSAYSSFLGGKLADAASAYRYVETLGLDGAVPTVNLALVARDAGRPEEALALWTKASLLLPKDAFVWNQRGWCYLSMGRVKDARESFKKAAEVSTLSAWTSEASFGRGMTEMADSSYRAAVEAFTSALLPSPYLIAATSARLGEVAIRLKKWNEAEVYFKQSLGSDSVQPDALQRLAWLFEKTDDPRETWIAYKGVLDLLPEEPGALKSLERAARYIPEKPERLLSVRRIARPLIQRPHDLPLDRRQTIRVGLYSNAAGEPGTTRRFYFVSGSDFKILHPELGEVNRGPANEQWEVAASKETGVIELRDVHGRLQYATKQAFRIQPTAEGASVLIKSPEIVDIRGVDVGDRELRGAVDAVPNVYGLQLVNEVPVEHYLLSRVAQVMPAGAPLESLKAAAVIYRTQLEWMRANTRPPPPLKTHSCDSRRCGLYAGVAEERDDATRAVIETGGAKLYRGEELHVTGDHPYCAGQTEDGVSDQPGGNPAASVYELELRAHSFPERESYDELTPHAKPSLARWTRVIEADALRRRVPGKDIGRIRQLTVARRSKTGRVEALEAIGVQGTVTIDGFSALEAFLSPGGLRSSLFTIQPIYDGRALGQVVLWGSGTGSGRGLCVSGALGLGAAGRPFTAILAHYAPGARVAGWTPAAQRAAANAKPQKAGTPSGSSDKVESAVPAAEAGGAVSASESARRPQRNMQAVREIRRKMRTRAKSPAAPSTSPANAP